MVKKIMRITVLAGVLSFMAFGTPDRAVSAPVSYTHLRAHETDS